MYPKGYRGFESLSLRHAVCTAEKTACNSCEIARLGRNCANLSRKADRRKYPAQSCRQAFAPFSLGGIRAVRPLPCSAFRLPPRARISAQNNKCQQAVVVIASYFLVLL